MEDTVSNLTEATYDDNENNEKYKSDIIKEFKNSLGLKISHIKVMTK